MDHCDPSETYDHPAGIDAKTVLVRGSLYRLYGILRYGSCLLLAALWLPSSLDNNTFFSYQKFFVQLLGRRSRMTHFVHQKGLCCTKVRGLAVDDERRGDGGFLPSRVRRSGMRFPPVRRSGEQVGALSSRRPRKTAGATVPKPHPVRGKPPVAQCRIN